MKEIPTGVKVLAVLNYIGAGLLVILGILTVLGRGVLTQAVPALAFFGASLFMAVGIILLALAVLGFFIGRGLWKGQKWARIVSIIFAALSAISGLFTLIGGAFASGIMNIIINGAIAGYLIFNAKVKQAFA